MVIFQLGCLHRVADNFAHNAEEPLLVEDNKGLVGGKRDADALAQEILELKKVLDQAAEMRLRLDEELGLLDEMLLVGKAEAL